MKQFYVNSFPSSSSFFPLGEETFIKQKAEMPNSIHLVKLRELPDVANLPANTYHGK